MSVENIISLIAALGVGGLLGAFLNSYFEQRKQTKEHDVKIFNQSDEILTEQRLFDIVNYHLLSDHSMDRDEIDELMRWLRFFDKVGNQYLDKKLITQSKKLFHNLDQFTDFIGHNFFTIKGQNSNNNYRYLRPDWNFDRAEGIVDSNKSNKYDECARQLGELANKTLEQYSRYRLDVKKFLKV